MRIVIKKKNSSYLVISF